MTIFNCLHLTDLHIGMNGLKDLWSNLEKKLFDDLEYLIENAGGLDLVLFTGDITQRAKPDEFKQANELLERFWKRFERMGHQPKFLAVPGNHDLIRPSDDNPVMIALVESWENPNIQKPFWGNEQSEQRKLLEKAFENYVQWWNKISVPTVDTYSTGILPGDFSATFEKEQFKLGIVGLNSAFLHLVGGDRECKLALDIRQFNAACHSNGAEWVEEHDLCLLMTHHPPSWLNAASERQLRGEIHDPPHRFALHLFGHMHKSRLTSLSEGGSKPRHRLQGCSLFGMEGWGDKNEERIHGYSLCQLKVDSSTPELFIYPRSAENKQNGSWTIDRDSSFELPKGEDRSDAFPVKLLRTQPEVDVSCSQSKCEDISSIIVPTIVATTQVLIADEYKQKPFVEDLPGRKAQNGVVNNVVEFRSRKLNESQHQALLSPREELLELQQNLDNLLKNIQSLIGDFNRRYSPSSNMLRSICEALENQEKVSVHLEEELRKKKVRLVDLNKLSSLTNQVNQNLSILLEKIELISCGIPGSSGYRANLDSAKSIASKILEMLKEMQLYYQKFLLKFPNK